METQTALAIPDEDNCMVVYLSSQDPESAHSVIASCLGLPQNNIRVITRRVGGGFGGKAGKAVPVSIFVCKVLIITNSCVRRSHRETLYIHGLNKPTNIIISI